MKKNTRKTAGYSPQRKPKTVALKIANCLDCPHHKKVTALYTGDSFDMIDEDVVCTLAKGQHRSQDGIIKGRCITGSNRPWQSRAQCAVPTWCPL
jgi:hypothetical protein